MKRIVRRKDCSLKSKTARENQIPGGLSDCNAPAEEGLPSYFGDYRPRYEGQRDIYEKARSHIREQKQKKG